MKRIREYLPYGTANKVAASLGFALIGSGLLISVVGYAEIVNSQEAGIESGEYPDSGTGDHSAADLLKGGIELAAVSGLLTVIPYRRGRMALHELRLDNQVEDIMPANDLKFSTEYTCLVLESENFGVPAGIRKELPESPNL